MGSPKKRSAFKKSLNIYYQLNRDTCLRYCMRLEMQNVIARERSIEISLKPQTYHYKCRPHTHIAHDDNKTL